MSTQGFIKNSDTFELLGLAGLPEDAKQQFILDISRITLQIAIGRLHMDDKLSEAQLADLRGMVEGSTSADLQDALVQMSPEVIQYLEDAVYEFKVGALQRQMDAFTQLPTTLHSQDLAKVVAGLRHAIDQDLPAADFEAGWQRYSEIRQVLATPHA